MTTELTYLFLSALLLSVAWIPHVVGQVMTQGLLTQDDYSNLREQSDFSAWVRRANRAHINLVEQFGAFAAFVLIAHVLGVSTPAMALASAIFFWARVLHFAVFLVGVRILMARTIIFTVAWLAIVVFAVGLWQGIS
jgi:uncharacterized MAPEG superfamily protein